MSWIVKAIELITLLDHRVQSLENELELLKTQNKNEHQLLRSQIVRVKNKEIISNDSIISGLYYNDLTPDKAYSIYSNHDYNFILLDVSDIQFSAPVTLNQVLKIPLHDLAFRFLEVTSHSIPVLIISEDGVKSILACEFYVSRGFYNVINVSGGYKHWPDAKYKKIKISA